MALGNALADRVRHYKENQYQKVTGTLPRGGTCHGARQIWHKGIDGGLVHNGDYYNELNTSNVFQDPKTTYTMPPDGWDVAPSTLDVIDNVATRYGWGTKVLCMRDDEKTGEVEICRQTGFDCVDRGNPYTYCKGPGWTFKQGLGTQSEYPSSWARATFSQDKGFVIGFCNAEILIRYKCKDDDCDGIAH